MPQWMQLTDKQKSKVRGIVGNDWEYVKVYLENEDTREGAFYKQSYKMIRLVWKKNNEEYTTTISAQVSGKEGGW